MRRKKIGAVLMTCILSIVMVAAGCGDKGKEESAEKDTFTAALPVDTAGNITQFFLL